MVTPQTSSSQNVYIFKKNLQARSAIQTKNSHCLVKIIKILNRRYFSGSEYGIKFPGYYYNETNYPTAKTRIIGNGTKLSIGFAWVEPDSIRNETILVYSIY